MADSLPPKTRHAADAALAKRVNNGDRDALRSFYDQHVDGLYAFVFFRVGKDEAIAEDVVQQTFLDSLQRLHRYDAERGSLHTWLCTESRNIIRSHLTAHSRSRELLDMWDQIDTKLAAVFDALDRAPLSDEVIERNETRELVNMTIAQLPEKYRHALESKYVDGESLSDMAARLATTEDAVKSMLARARRAFKATFQTLVRSMSGQEVST